jgi:hypothetical protein
MIEEPAREIAQRRTGRSQMISTGLVRAKN